MSNPSADRGPSSSDPPSPLLSPLAELAQLCRREVICEKWLVAPTRRAGQQWLDQLARCQTPVLNVHLFSPRSLALTLAGPTMAAAGVAAAMGPEATWWMDLAWQTLQPQHRGELTRQPSRPALAEAVRRSVDALRLTGLTADALTDATSTAPASDTSDASGANAASPTKFEQVSALMRHYLQLLEQHSRWDYAHVLQAATETLQREGLPRDVLLIVADDAAQWPLERHLLAAAPEDRRRGLPAPPLQQTGADHRLLTWLDAAHQAPAPTGDETVHFFRATGEANEIREVFRRIVADNIPLDDVELMYVNGETYLPLIYELARSWVDEDRPLGIDVTFAEGISTRYSRPGRALLQWLRWLGEDCPQRILIDMYQEGLFSSVPSGDRQREQRLPTPTAWQLARRLREATIGVGRDRYQVMLNEQVQAARQAVLEARADGDRPATESDDPDAPDPAAAAERLRRLRIRWFQWRILRRHVRRLMQLTPDVNDSPTAVLHQVRQFVTEHTVRSSAMDNRSLRQLRNAITDVLRWLKTAQPGSWDVWQWLERLVNETQAHDSGPRPGAIHVSPALQGGHAQRRHCFIVGLDDTKFPGVGLQDPILLDSERRDINPSLPLGGDEPRKRILALAQTFARLDGQVTLSCTTESLVEDRSLYPSPVMHSAARLAGVPTEAWEHAVSFAPQRLSEALSEGQWWLAQLCRTPGDEARKLVYRHYPHLGRGARAAAARFGTQLTEFNGHVPEAAEALSPLVDPADFDDPNHSMRGWSASAMETAGACPLRFFFRYGLRVRPLDEWVIDEERWLDPLQYGSLMHEVFRDFMGQCAAQGESPSFELHHQQLATVLKTHVDALKRRHPPPSESAFRQQLRLMLIAAGVFLEEEQRHCEEFAPRYFEAAIGLEGDGDPTAIDTPRPLPIRLPDGRCLAASGRVDRVDEHRDAPGLYQIWDYKTGSSRRYEVNKPFRNGQHIQNTFYHALVERALQQQIAPDASVSGFGYFFPGATAWGHRIQWTTEQLKDGPRVLALLADVMSAGAYVPTSDDKICKFCDYREICDPDTARLVAAGKRQSEAADELKAWEELKDVK